MRKNNKEPGLQENANPASMMSKTKKTASVLLTSDLFRGTSNGIRTHVSALRGRRPRPLDNGGKWLGNKDLNLDNTSQSRRCCRYTIPQRCDISQPQGILYYCPFRLSSAFLKKSHKNRKKICGSQIRHAARGTYHSLERRIISSRSTLHSRSFSSAGGMSGSYRVLWPKVMVRFS